MKKERELRNFGINSTLEGNKTFHNVAKIDAESVILENYSSVEKKLNASKSPNKTLSNDIRDNNDCKCPTRFYHVYSESESTKYYT